MPSLSASRRLVLATAAARLDGAVLPLPHGFSVRGRARRLMLEGMRGLIAERPAQDGEPAPARAQGVGDFALEVTPKARALVGLTDQEPPSQDSQTLEPATPRLGTNAEGRESDAPHSPKPSVRPGTKQALLIDPLRRPEGASIAEIQRATGWQPHTARAAIPASRRRALR